MCTIRMLLKVNAAETEPKLAKVSALTFGSLGIFLMVNTSNLLATSLTVYIHFSIFRSFAA